MHKSQDFWQFALMTRRLQFPALAYSSQYSFLSLQTGIGGGGTNNTHKSQDFWQFSLMARRLQFPALAYSSQYSFLSLQTGIGGGGGGGGGEIGNGAGASRF